MKHKRTLKSLLNKSFFNTALIPLIVIELTLLALYFSISNFLVSNSQESLLKEIKHNVESIMAKETNFIENQLKIVSTYADTLQNEQQHIFKNKEKFLKIEEKPNFKFAKNGVMYKVKDDGGSSLFYANNTKITQKQIDKAHFTEAFDSSLKHAVNSSDLIVASYFNSYDNMNRLYPFIPEVYSQFPADIKMKDYNFYYEADSKHNPAKNPVWTDAYLDPAGQGWMISCIVPIYNKDFLEGVTGLDVTIDKFVQNILNLDLPWGAKAFLASTDGTIIAMPSEVEQILGIKELKEHNYKETIKSTQLKPEDLNLYKNDKLFKIFNPLQMSNNSIDLIKIDDKEYILGNSTMNLTGWKMFILVDESIVFESVHKVEQTAKEIGLYAIIGMVIFYILFFIYLYNKIKLISNDIANPISKLASATKNFSSKIKVSKFENVDIAEIDLLSTNFNMMSQSLHKNTTQLEELNKTLENKVEEEVTKNREKDQKIFKQARLAQIGEMINMIAHQWRQPLNAISATTNNLIFKLMLDEYDKKFFENETKLISNYSQQLSKTIDNFRNFFKNNHEVVETTLDEIIDSTLDIIETAFQSKNITINKEFHSDRILHINSNDLQHVLINILKNSEDAILHNNIKEGIIKITTNEDKQNQYIYIEDNGGGIDSTILDKIFDPYFSTKTEKEGVGLGLYMSKVLLSDNIKGEMEVSSKDKTTTFKITLPIREIDV